MGSASKGIESRKEKGMRPGAKQWTLDTAGHTQLHTLLPKHRPYAKAWAIQSRWYLPLSAFLCAFSETSTAALGLATWVANSVPEKNLFFWFSKEIKKFPSSSRRLWCQTVWVSAKLLQTLSRSSVNLSYGGSAFPGVPYTVQRQRLCLYVMDALVTRHSTAQLRDKPTGPARPCRPHVQGQLWGILF